MYERFFGLDELPFQLTPDPRYLFLSSKHREALAHLVFGIREGAGFVCITGEIGAGKTTLLRALLREADESIKYAYILNPVLAGVELVQEINHELGAASSGSRRELLTALNQTLVEHRAAGRRVVLVIDEAQALDGGILEQLRLLSNFETETAKLLQIVLVGQPELRDLLGRPDLEQLNQRVTVRWHLGRLDRAETEQYVAHRVRTAGQTRSLFSRGAIELIHAYARGIPRLINVACHRSLLVAYAADRPRVTSFVARRAIAELRRYFRVRAASPRRPWAWAATGAAATAAAAAALGLLVSRDASPVLGWWRPAAVSGPPAGAPAPEAEHATPIVAADPVSAVTAAASAPAIPASAAAPSGASPPLEDTAPGQERADAVAPVLPVNAAASTDPVVDPLAVERASLAEALRETTPGNSAYEATEALLRAWGVAPLTPQEASSPTLDLQTIGRTRGLEYLSLSGNLNLLRVLDLPAILELAPDDGSASRFATLGHLGDDATRVMIGRSAIQASPAVLAEAWFGKAHLFWRDVDQLGGLMALGTANSKVRRLHALLRGVGVYDGPDAPVFDLDTEQAVMRFQRTKRLVADGKAGPMTMIVLYQSVADDRVPRLGAEPRRPANEAEQARAPNGREWN